ncbi:hypothetical protein QBC39DRAFT_333109 [Podospora conica]|nr:hypothetical protein QBC39DRAFT_333109 [Schizothecium conicum]
MFSSKRKNNPSTSEEDFVPTTPSHRKTPAPKTSVPKTPVSKKPVPKTPVSKKPVSKTPVSNTPAWEAPSTIPPVVTQSHAALSTPVSLPKDKNENPFGPKGFNIYDAESSDSDVILDLSPRSLRNRTSRRKAARARNSSASPPHAKKSKGDDAAVASDGGEDNLDDAAGLDDAADINDKDLSALLREFQKSHPQYIEEEIEENEDEGGEEPSNNPWLEHPPVEDTSQPAVDTTSTEGKANIERCQRRTLQLFTSIKATAEKMQTDSGIQSQGDTSCH